MEQVNQALCTLISGEEDQWKPKDYKRRVNRNDHDRNLLQESLMGEWSIMGIFDQQSR